MANKPRRCGKIATKLTVRKGILCMIIAILLVIVIIFIYSSSLISKSLESQLFEFFSIARDDSIILSEIGRDELDVFYAELIVPADKKDEIFEAYSHASKETNLEYLPPSIRHRIERLPSDYEVDYYYILFASLLC